MDQKFQEIDLCIALSIGLMFTFLTAINYLYIDLFPKINENIFEQLIQVNATILGFTILAIFHYLSKFDDYKKNQLDILFKITEKVKGKFPSDEDIYKEIINAYNKFNQTFDQIDEMIKYYAKIIVIFYGIGIIVSFFCLFLFANDKEKWLFLIWSFLFLSIFLISATIYYYHKFWSDVKLLKKSIDSIIEEEMKSMNKF